MRVCFCWFSTRLLACEALLCLCKTKTFALWVGVYSNTTDRATWPCCCLLFNLLSIDWRLVLFGEKAISFCPFPRPCVHDMTPSCCVWCMRVCVLCYARLVQDEVCVCGEDVVHRYIHSDVFFFFLLWPEGLTSFQQMNASGDTSSASWYMETSTSDFLSPKSTVVDVSCDSNRHRRKASSLFARVVMMKLPSMRKPARG